MKEEKKIIPFNKIITVIEREETDIPEPTMRVIESPPGNYCNHDHVTIFIHHRQLQCTRCGAMLDPFDFIFHQAREGNCHLSTLRWYRVEVKRLEKEKEDLKNEIQNLKAQKRKLL